MSQFKTSELRDTSQELQELREQLKEAKRDNELMMLNLSQCGQQLAASQAREQQLRKALTELLCYNEKSIWIGGVENGYLQSVGSAKLNAILKCESALSSPQDTTALEAMIAKAGEVMRERCLSLRSAHLINSGCVRALPGVTLEDLK